MLGGVAELHDLCGDSDLATVEVHVRPGEADRLPTTEIPEGDQVVEGVQPMTGDRVEEASGLRRRPDGYRRCAVATSMDSELPLQSTDLGTHNVIDVHAPTGSDQASPLGVARRLLQASSASRRVRREGKGWAFSSLGPAATAGAASPPSSRPSPITRAWRPEPSEEHRP